ncbi:MAG: T9SS type A sorting domain-containing protein, partial [Ignavibacteriales bacterium]|nr:T9SS type A sorting domain-containing protein [Ignavibacteriales bacterium]
GTFTLSSGATLGIGSADGITSSGSTGNIQTTTRNFDTAAKYTYNGSSAQVTGNGLPASVNTLTINNSNGVTLTSGVNVTDYLTMTSGNITLNDQSLILGTAASAANKGSLTWSYGTSGYMVGGGSFTRWADTNEGGIFFPFGTATQRRSLQIYGTPTTGGTVSATYSDASGATSLSFTDNSMSFDKRSNLSWIIGIANGFVASGLTMTISPYSMPGVTNVSDLTLCISSGTAPGTYAVPFGSNDPVLDLDRTNLNSGDIGGVTFYVGAKTTSPLPVQLTSFTASNVNNVVQLNWQTATEVNNYGFEVERQPIPNPSQREGNSSWTKIGFVNGHGNSNSPKSYSFTDNLALTHDLNLDRLQYRLKQIDFDGKFEYSNIVEVNVEVPAAFILHQNSPNPFNPTTEIKFSLPKNSNVELSVYNLLGEIVQRLAKGMMNAGEHKVVFDASNLSSGVYIYKLTMDNYFSTRKMVLLK